MPEVGHSNGSDSTPKSSSPLYARAVCEGVGEFYLDSSEACLLPPACQCFLVVNQIAVQKAGIPKALRGSRNLVHAESRLLVYTASSEWLPSKRVHNGAEAATVDCFDRRSAVAEKPMALVGSELKGKKRWRGDRADIQLIQGAAVRFDVIVVREVIAIHPL